MYTYMYTYSVDMHRFTAENVTVSVSSSGRKVNPMFFLSDAHIYIYMFTMQYNAMQCMHKFAPKNVTVSVFSSSGRNVTPSPIQESAFGFINIFCLQIHVFTV